MFVIVSDEYPLPLLFFSGLPEALHLLHYKRPDILSRLQIIMADNGESVETASPNHNSEMGKTSTKRRKRDKDRTRVSRACDSCKR
jgi:hypothetical protein